MIINKFKEDVAALRSLFSKDMLATAGCILSILAVVYALYQPSLMFGDKILIILLPMTLVILLTVSVLFLVWLIRAPSIFRRSKLPKLHNSMNSEQWFALLKLSDAPYSNDVDTLNLSLQIIHKLESSLITERQFVPASEVISKAEKIRAAGGNQSPVSDTVRSFAYEHNIFPGGRPLLLTHAFDLVCSIK